MERIIQRRVDEALAAQRQDRPLYRIGFEAITNTPDYDLPTGMADGTATAVPLRLRGGASSRIENLRPGPAAVWHHTYMTRLVLAQKNAADAGTTLDTLAAPFVALNEQVLDDDPEKLFAQRVGEEATFEFDGRQYGVAVGVPMQRGYSHLHRLDPGLSLPTDQLFIRRTAGEDGFHGSTRQTIATGAAAIKLFADYGIPDNSLANLTEGGENLFTKVNAVFA